MPESETIPISQKKDNSPVTMGLNNAIQILVSVDGKPALFYFSDTRVDYEACKGLVERCKTEDGFIKDTFETVEQNLSPVDQSVYLVDRVFFRSFFCALSCFTPGAIEDEKTWPSHAEVFLALFR